MHRRILTGPTDEPSAYRALQMRFLTDREFSKTFRMLARPPQRSTGPLNVTILVPAAATSKKAADPKGRLPRATFEEEVRREAVEPWLEEMMRIAPDLTVNVRFAFGYKGYVPTGTGDDSATAMRLVQSGIADAVIERNRRSPGSAPVTSRDKYIVAFPEFSRSDPLISARGRAMVKGSSGYYWTKSPGTFAHELGHMMGATHEDSGYGLFGWGKTFMSRDGFFAKNEYSDRNTRNIRAWLGVDLASGRQAA